MPKKPKSADRSLDASRQILLCRRAELRERLASVTSDLRREAEPLSPDFAEQAAQRENDAVLDSLYLGTQAELKEVDHALERIDSGSYGICESCGQAIERPRLMALPQVSRCGRCAEDPRRPKALT